ncbi:MAG: polyprenyl synthetase family protein, partial [Actinomycetota bacterium]|nr:polyprenyl synthetase family protein [Actinomycetota bacterium]
LREGKPTPLMAEAFTRASPQQSSVLEKIGSRDLTLEDISRIQEVVEETGARDVVENEIEELTGEALEALDVLPLEGNASDALGELAHFVAYRAY